MAFGDLKGTLNGGAVSVASPASAAGSVVVAIGDLIVGMYSELGAIDVTAMSCTGVTVPGGVLTAVNAGTLSSVAGRMFYGVATSAGTLTAVTATITPSGNDYAIVAAVFEGPFVAQATVLDRAPTNTTDAATPFTCAATGVLSQANELIVAGCALTRGNVTSATAPLLHAVIRASTSVNTANSCSASIGYQTVAATTSVTPVFSVASGTINGGVQIVATFRQGTAIPPNGDLALTEAADTISAAGNSIVSGTLARTEAADTIAAAGTVASTGGTATYLVSSYTPGAPRNDYPGYVGLAFRTDTITEHRYNRMGIRAASGNTGLHTVGLYQYTGGDGTPIGTPFREVAIDLTGSTTGNWYYAEIPEITLGDLTPYFLAATVTAGGQSWAGDGPVTLIGSVAVYSAYGPASGAYSSPATVDGSFVGVDLALIEGTAPSDITGTLTITQAAQTLVSVGSVSVSGTLSRTEAADTITSTGTVVVTGTLGITEAADTISAAGTVGFPVITGTLTVTEAADTISAAAGPVVGGTLIRTEAADTISAAGTVGVSGTLVLTEAADTIISAGVVGTAPAVGTLVLTEAPDTVSAAGTVRVSGTLEVVEAADTLAATGGPIARGTLSLTEAADTIVAAGGPVARGTLSVTQANQTLAATAVSAVGGVLNVIEAADILAATGEIVAFDEVTGTLARTQANNTLAATGYRVFFSGEPGTVPITPGDRIVLTGQGERTIVSGVTTRMLYASQDVRAVVSDAKPRLIMAASLRRVA